MGEDTKNQQGETPNAAKQELSPVVEIRTAVQIYEKFFELAKNNSQAFTARRVTFESKDPDEVWFYVIEARAIVDNQEYELAYWVEPKNPYNPAVICERITVNKPQPPAKHPLEKHRYPESELVFQNPSEEIQTAGKKNLGVTTIKGQATEIIQIQHDPMMSMSYALDILTKAGEQQNFKQPQFQSGLEDTSMLYSDFHPPSLPAGNA